MLVANSPQAAAPFSFFMPQNANPRVICFLSKSMWTDYWASIKFCLLYAIVNGINFITTFIVPIGIINAVEDNSNENYVAFTTVSNSYYDQFDVRLYRAFLHANSCHFINIPFSSNIWNSTDASRHINALVAQTAARPLRINYYMYISWVHINIQHKIFVAWNRFSPHRAFQNWQSRRNWI